MLKMPVYSKYIYDFFFAVEVITVECLTTRHQSSRCLNDTTIIIMCLYLYICILTKQGYKTKNGTSLRENEKIATPQGAASKI